MKGVKKKFIKLKKIEKEKKIIEEGEI